MRGGTDGVAHVVQRIEQSYEIIVPPPEILGAADLKADIATALDQPVRMCNGGGVIVDTDELGIRKGVRHQQR